MSTRKHKPQRAPDQAQTSISISKEVLEKGRAEAAADGRSFSNWLERLIEKNVTASAIAEDSPEYKTGGKS